MRKIVLSVVLLLCLVFSAAMVVMAEPGFHIGAGYEEINNTISVDIGDMGLDISTPAKMYTVDLGYDFDDNFAINGKFSWGSSDIVKVDLGSMEIPITQDNQYWQVEAVYKVPVSDNFKIGGIIGYANSQTTFNGDINGIDPWYASGELKQSFDGAYIGALFTIAPTSNFEVGAAYRYLLGPTGDLDVSGSYSFCHSGSFAGTHSLDDLHVSTLEVYGKLAIDKNWSAKAGYTYSWVDYTIDSFDVDNRTGSLWAKVEYKF